MKIAWLGALFWCFTTIAAVSSAAAEELHSDDPLGPDGKVSVYTPNYDLPNRLAHTDYTCCHYDSSQSFTLLLPSSLGGGSKGRSGKEAARRRRQGRWPAHGRRLRGAVLSLTIDSQPAGVPFVFASSLATRSKHCSHAHEMRDSAVHAAGIASLNRALYRCRSRRF